MGLGIHCIAFFKFFLTQHFYIYQMLWENLVNSVGMMGGGRGGLVTAVMNHLAPPLPTSTQNTPSNKRNEPIEQTEGLYNFAPLAVVTSSNPTARPANVLVDSNQLFQRTKVRKHLFVLMYEKQT